MTTRAKKDVQLAEITDHMQRSAAVILTDYRGFSVAELAQIRGELRPQQVRYMIAKNTLTRRAAQAAGLSAPDALFAGPTALAFLLGDLPAPARKLLDLSRARKPLPLKGLIIGKQVSGPDAVERLATVAPREQLYAQVVGGIASPVVGLLGVLQGTVAGLAYLLQARVQQLGGAPDGAAPDGAAAAESAAS